MDDEGGDALVIHDGRHSKRAAEILRGTARLFRQMGWSSLAELQLANARRADLVAFGPKGDIWIVEIKSSVQDFQTDRKWPDYAAYCDRLYFAVAEDFPFDLVPEDTGLIVADRFGAEILRDPGEHRLTAARRKAMLLRFAHGAAGRLHAILDPGPGSTHVS